MRKIIAINMAKERLDRLKRLVGGNADIIETSDRSACLGALLGENVSCDNDFTEYKHIVNEAVVFCGFDGTALNGTLDMLKKSGLDIPLKAVYIPQNKNWSVGHLLNELADEYERLTNRGESGNG